MNVKQVFELATNVFGKRSGLLLLWQEISEHFYPQRADFTQQRSLGTDFAAQLMTSYPILCRRELSDQTGTMLRPVGKEWKHMTLGDAGRESNEVRRKLESMNGSMRRAMYDPASLFTKAQKEADNDFASFGQCVTSTRLNRNRDALLYRCWHLRDCAWIENEEGSVGSVFRKWKLTAQVMRRLWGDKIHSNVQKLLDRDPFAEVECMHMVVEMELYDGEIDTYDQDPLRGGFSSVRRKANARERERYPFVSIYYDCQNQHMLEAVAVWFSEYNVSRWETVSGSQYAFSPAVVAALPEARLLQSMTYTLLEAGEKVTNPPMIATQDVVRSDMAIYAGGTTWVDRDYDERLGAALRPMEIDGSGMPIGIDMQRDSRNLLAQCFYLNKLKPFTPTADPQMTAFQAGQIVAQYIRDALPLFEPMEMERNGKECELTLQVLMRTDIFGSPFDWPEEMLGADIKFRFESPLHDLIESQKGQKFLEAKQLIAEAVSMDQKAGALLDVVDALRDALNGTGVPAKWIRDEVTVQQITDQQQAADDATKVLAAMGQGSEIVKNLGAGMKDRAAAAPATV